MSGILNAQALQQLAQHQQNMQQQLVNEPFMAGVIRTYGGGGGGSGEQVGLYGWANCGPSPDNLKLLLLEGEDE